MIKHFLNFIYPLNIGKIEIDEPIGLDAVPYVLRADPPRLGRDVKYIGDDAGSFILKKWFRHEFDNLVKAFELANREMIVHYIVETPDTSSTYQIDGRTFSTDYVEQCSFNCIETGSALKLKQNYDVEDNINSNVDIDGNGLTPAEQQLVLVNAKPVVQVSKWKNAHPNKEYVSDSLDGDYFNPMQTQEQYDIQDSLTWIDDNDDDSADNFRVLRLDTNANNIKIDFYLPDAVYKYRPNEITSVGNKIGVVRLLIRWGQSFATAQEQTVWVANFSGGSDQQINIPENLSFTIPFLNATDIVWVYFRASSTSAAVNRVKFGQEATTTITATSVSMSTVVPCVRLVDAMRRVVKSISGLNISAPDYEFGGKYYNLFITTSALMRYIQNKPFNLSLKDIIEDGLSVAHGDYQLLPDNTVEFRNGIKGFYRNVEALAAPQMTDHQSEIYQVLNEYEVKENERYSALKMSVTFNKYASQKENGPEGTYDIVHGQKVVKFPTKICTNSFDVVINWVFDPFMIEDERRKAFEVSKDTATQDSDTIFCVETTSLPPGRTEIQTAFLRHEVLPDPETPGEVFLVLLNTGDFSWVQLGIVVGDTFFIQTNENGGGYFVKDVTDTKLTLENDAASPGFVEGVNTRFKYFVNSDVVLQTRTNQGITNIEGLSDGENYGNLAYTSARIMREAYDEVIKTISLFTPEQLVRNLTYKNNPDAQTTINGITIKEGADFIGFNGRDYPILTPMEHTVTLILPFNTVMQLFDDIRIEKGYIRTIRPDNAVLKLYPKSIEAVTLRKNAESGNTQLMSVTVVGEEKYTPAYLSIMVSGDSIIINGEDIVDEWHFYIRNGKLHIQDASGLLLFTPVPYNKVTINNGTPFTSELSLELALNSII